MSGSKKRTLSDFLGAANTPRAVPEFNVPQITVTEQRWSEISDEASTRRALVTHSKYRNANTWKTGYVDLTHTHGEFKKIVSTQYKIQKHNVSTAELGSAARSFPNIVDRLSDEPGARDALRVLKGTHLDHGLQSTEKDERRAAVELGTEIGVSEYLRGSTIALTDASINLYRVKHGRLAKKRFFGSYERLFRRRRRRGRTAAGDRDGQRCIQTLRRRPEAYLHLACIAEADPPLGNGPDRKAHQAGEIRCMARL